MTFEQAKNYLYNLQFFGIKLGLESMTRFLAKLGNPHEKLKFIHIAGTNGKGSTAAILERILRQAGYKTGLYTSPHLVDIRERMLVNGEVASEKEFTELVELVKPFIDKNQSTYFEATTAMAIQHFYNNNVDIVLLETGLGGRLDATNVVTPLASVITSIDFDHAEHLGDTLEKIAYEKAGIIKPNIPCVIGDIKYPALQVIEKTCKTRNSKLYKSNKYKIEKIKTAIDFTEFTITKENLTHSYNLGLVGEHQVKNAILALTILDSISLPVKEQAIKSGLKNTNWPGRFQIIHKNPTIIYDVAHNPASMKVLVKTLTNSFPKDKVNFTLSLMKDKNIPIILKYLEPVCHQLYYHELETERCLTKSELTEIIKNNSINIELSRAINLKKFIISNKNRPICVTGTHYIAETIHNLIKTLDLK